MEWEAEKSSPDATGSIDRQVGVALIERRTISRLRFKVRDMPMINPNWHGMDVAGHSKLVYSRLWTFLEDKPVWDCPHTAH